jgi:hypothetical protein
VRPAGAGPAGRLTPPAIGPFPTSGRDDYRKAKDYRLETFHNDFVRQGGISI